MRLMLAGLLLGIVHDRRLMREAQVNIAIRWFIGYGLHERLPDHSSLTRIRQRWGEGRFREIFQRTVTACLDAKIATAEVVHIDASLIRADASWESLVERHADDVMTANPDDRKMEAGGKRSRGRGKSGKVSRTDPDASMATSAENRRLEPCYKQHTAVDDGRGVVLDVAVTTGAVSERETIKAQVDEVRAITGRKIETVTARCRLCLRQGLRRSRAPWHRPSDPGAQGPVKEPGSPASLPLRRKKRHPEVPTWEGPASPADHRARSLLQFQDQRLHTLPAQGRLFAENTHQQRGGDPARLSSAAPRSSPARAMERGRSAAISTPSMALRGLPRRGEDLARARARDPARPRQHEDPSPPHGRGDQSQAARHRSSCHPVGHLGISSRREGSTVPPSCPHTPN